MKTKYVFALTAVLLASACSPTPNGNDWQTDRDTRVCRDNRGKRVDDSQCRGGARTGGAGSAFMWYYLGRGSYVPPVGSTFASDARGSYAPRAGATYYTATKAAPASAVTRGGFGSSARSSGGSFSSGS